TEDHATRSLRLEAGFADTGKRLAAVERQLRQVHEDVSKGLLQYHLLLGRLARNLPAGGEGSETKRFAPPPLPLELCPGTPLPWEAVGGGVTHPDPEGVEWLHLTSCPVCGHAE